MNESFVQLLCPECSKNWTTNPTKLGPLDSPFDCPDCDERRPTREFLRTHRDLEMVKQFEAT
jgi:predicted RNA-binding Zn-ribbon protein involved in translation (DUF1610 family)